jgi:hypothetical protein
MSHDSYQNSKTVVGLHPLALDETASLLNHSTNNSQYASTNDGANFEDVENPASSYPTETATIRTSVWQRL